jgi:hypothetical protein
LGVNILEEARQRIGLLDYYLSTVGSLPNLNPNDPFYLTPHFLQGDADDGEEDDTYIQLVPSEEEWTSKERVKRKFGIKITLSSQ